METSNEMKGTEENACLRRNWRMLQTSQSLVKYTTDVELEDPDFEKNLQTIITATKQYIEESVKGEGLNRAVRDAHAKGYGLARAEVEILGGLALEYAQGIYALPGRHEALIRFSNGSPHTGADAALGSVVMGMGLKIFGIDGRTLLEDEPDSHTFDYALINAPIFSATRWSITCLSSGCF